jgi:hypothetical protein
MASLASPARPVKTSKPAARPARKPAVRLVGLGPDLGNGVRIVRLIIDGEHSAYLIRKIASAWGVAFEVEKLFRKSDDDSPRTYSVNLDTGWPKRSTCECRGHLRHTARTGKPCRHVSSLLALIADGRLDGAPVRPAAPVTCPCGGAPVVSTGECQRCCDAAADRAARMHDAGLNDL